MGKRLLFLAALLLAALLPACAGQAAVTSLSPLRVAVVTPLNDTTYWSLLNNGTVQAGEDLGIDVRVETPTVNYSVAQMTALIQKATASRVDGLIVQGIDDEEYLQALQSARDVGIPVVFVDTDVQARELGPYVGTDNFAAGRLLGEQLIALCAGSPAGVGVISGDTQYSNLQERLEGLEAALKDVSNIRVVEVGYDQFDNLIVAQLYKEYLENDEIDTIVCLEGTGGLVVGAIPVDGEPPLRILAFDYTNGTAAGIRSGQIAGVVNQDAHMIGYRAVEVLAAYIAQGGLTQREYFTQVQYITAENLAGIEEQLHEAR